MLGQVATINNRLDTHDRRIARTEKFQAGDDLDDGYEEEPPRHEHGGGWDFGAGGGFGGGLGGGGYGGLAAVNLVAALAATDIAGCRVEMTD